MQILGNAVTNTDTDVNRTDTDMEENADSSQKDLVCVLSTVQK